MSSDDADPRAPIRDALPDGVVLDVKANRQTVLRAAADQKTVACPDCDSGGALYARVRANTSHDGDVLRCDECGWIGGAGAARLRRSQSYLSAAGRPTPPEGSLARRLLETNADEVFGDD